MRLVDIDIFPLLPNKLDGDESEYERGYHDATDNLKALPLVDAVPVVRCCECKYYENPRLKAFENCCRKDLLIPMKPNDYCSYGIKMGEAK